jgi:hypothetical protein
MPADRRIDRWTDTTAAERRAQMAEVTAAKRRAALDRQIDRLADSAAVLTEQQKAKLAQLLNGQPESGAA